VDRTRTRIISTLLIVLLGAAQTIAAVCDSFCPAHAGGSVQAASHAGSHAAERETSAASTHGHHHHAAGEDAASPVSPRLDARPAGCCDAPVSPAQTMTAARASSSREAIAAAANGAPSLAPQNTEGLTHVRPGLPPDPSRRAPAILTLRI